jgi:glutaminyl-peptide cyclotransferase
MFDLMRALLYGVVLLLVACQKQKPVTETGAPADTRPAPEWKAFPQLTYEVIKELPHDAGAYTQGLLLSQGHWIESTGGNGSTSLRRVEKETGKVLVKKDLGENFFGEGLAELHGKLYQLTWKNEQGFVYDAKTLQWQKNFSYSGEGWGLTTDGKSLIMSNGSDRLRFIDPNNFRVLREVIVRRDGKSVDKLNELEFVEGEIFANVWFSEEILRINPADGTVVGVIDLTGIDSKETRKKSDHVLNGIAYDPVARELFVTGKCWPKIYQIRLVEKK